MGEPPAHLLLGLLQCGDDQTALEVVVSGKDATLNAWGKLRPADRARGLGLLRRVEGFFGEDTVSADPRPPYIAGWHQAPVHAGRDLTRLHLQLFSLRRAPGKLKYLAGSESGMAAWINDVTPEQIAERLRAAGS